MYPPLPSVDSGRPKIRSKYTLMPITKRGVRIEMPWNEERDPTPEEIEDFDWKTRATAAPVERSSDHEFTPFPDRTAEAPPVDKFGKPLEDTLTEPEHEPDTYLGGFFGSIKHDILGATVDNPMLQSIAHPKELRDFMPYIAPMGEQFLGMPGFGRMMRAAKPLATALEDVGGQPWVKSGIRDVLGDTDLSLENRLKTIRNIRESTPRNLGDEVGGVGDLATHDQRMAQRIYDSELKAAAKRMAVASPEFATMDTKTQRMFIKKLQDDAVAMQDAELLKKFPKPARDYGMGGESGSVGPGDLPPSAARSLKIRADLDKMREQPWFQELDKKLQETILDQIRRGETVLPTEAMPKIRNIDAPPVSLGPKEPPRTFIDSPEFNSPEWRAQAVAMELAEQPTLGAPGMWEKGSVTPGDVEPIPTRIGQPELPGVPPVKQPVWNTAMSVAQIGRQSMSSGDLSALFRQAYFVSTRKQFWTNVIPMVKALKEVNYIKGMEEIENRRTFPLMQNVGLAFTDLGKDLANREERFMSTLLEDIPVLGKWLFKPSAQAYTYGLNKIRADLFDSMILEAQRGGMEPERYGKVLPQIADYINMATGRGKFGMKKLEESATALNAFFFAPRLMASRFQILNPLTYMDPRIDRFVKTQAIRDLLGTAALSSSMLYLAKLAGASVELDPRSADFGKARFGKTRIDMTGGMGQYIRFAAQVLTQSSKSTNTGKVNKFGSSPVAPTGLDVVYNFFQNKEAPIPSFITGILSGKDYKGDPFEVGPEVLRRYAPMIAQDIWEVAHEDPKMLPVTIPASVLGFGVQSYTPKSRRARGGRPAVAPVNPFNKFLSGNAPDLIR